MKTKLIILLWLVVFSSTAFGAENKADTMLVEKQHFTTHALRRVCFGGLVAPRVLLISFPEGFAPGPPHSTVKFREIVTFEYSWNSLFNGKGG